jgi:hypothetical protein
LQLARRRSEIAQQGNKSLAEQFRRTGEETSYFNQAVAPLIDKLLAADNRTFGEQLNLKSSHPETENLLPPGHRPLSRNLKFKKSAPVKTMGTRSPSPSRA